MRILFILFLISSAISRSWGQLDWVKGGVTTDVVYVNQNHLIAIGWDGLMIRSLDAGVTWSQVKLNTTENLLAISFADNNLGVIAGANSFYITQNGGGSWSAIANPFPNPRHLKVFNDSIWCLSLENRLVKTTNGGISWDTTYHIPSQNFNVYQVIYHNIDTVFLFLSYNSFQLRRTTTGGLAWDSLSLNVPGQFNLRGASIVNGKDLNIAFSAGIPGQYVARSSDFGNTWDTIRIQGNPSSVDRYVFLDTNIIYSHGGQQITRYNYTNPQVLNTTSFPMCRYGLKVYSHSHAVTTGFGDIHSTQNNWTTFSGDTTKISLYTQMTYLNNNKIIGFAHRTIEPLCYTLGGGIVSSKFVMSNDGGNTWQFRDQVGMEYPIQFHTNYSVVKDTFVFYKTMDEGYRYNFVSNQLMFINTIPLLGSANQIQVFDNGIGYFSKYQVGSGSSLPGGILKTTNLGLTWNHLSNAPANNFYFLSSDTGFIIGNQLFRTFNGGLSWDTITSNLPSNTKNLYFHNSNIGFLQSSNFSDLYRTTDGGISWNLSHSVPGFAIDEFRVINNVIFVLFYSSPFGGNSYGNIHYSSDFGATWHTDPRLNNLSHQLQPTHINQAGELLLYGNHKAVFKIANFNSLLSTAFTMPTASKFVVYPNPSNDVFRISGISIGDNLVQIFDLQGKLALVQQITNSDEFVNISQLHEGLYIVRVGTRSAKLVVKR